MNRKQLEQELGIVLSKTELYERVHKIVQRDDIRFSEAILEVCKELQLEPEDMSKLVAGPLKEKLRHECMNYRILKDTRGNSLAGI